MVGISLFCHQGVDSMRTYTIWKALDNNPYGAMVEIKDRRDGIWDAELFFNYQKQHNYLIEITESGDEGITQSYHTQNQKHALKVYNDIVKNKDYKWGKNYLDRLVEKAEIKHKEQIEKSFQKWIQSK